MIKRLNDESNLILGEFLNDLNTSHLDEEINKMLQMIGKSFFFFNFNFSK